MSNVYILESQQLAWRQRPLIEAEPGSGNNHTLVLRNSSGAPVALTGLEIIGQQRGNTYDVLNRGTDPIYLLPDNTESIESNQFADGATIPDDGSVRLYYNGLNWEALSGNDSGKLPSLFSNYANDLAAAIDSIGAKPTTLLVNVHSNVSTALVVPATLTLVPANGAQLHKTDAGSIEFQGMGLANPESQIPFFDGFANGDIRFTGTVFPSRLSANLWNAADSGIKINRALWAVKGKSATIAAYPGNLSEQVRVFEHLSLHLTQGTYASTLTGAYNIPIVLESNTRLYGDGQGRTFIIENADSARIVYGSSITVYPFDGYNENLEVTHITFKGNPLTHFDSASSAVLLGNVTNGAVRFCTFSYTHGFAAFVGAYSDSGNVADGVWLTDNMMEGLGTQYMGTIGGRNIFIQRNHFIVSIPVGSAFAAVIDIEPNANTDGSENIQITDNIMDGTRTLSGWHGMAVNQAYGKVLRNLIVARNTIIGSNESLVQFVSTDIDVGSNSITVYHSTYQTGDPISMVKDDFGNGGALPGGLGPTPFNGFAIRTGMNALKLATTQENALAGIAVEITDQGSGLYVLYSAGHLSAGIKMFGASAGIVADNLIVGANHGAMEFAGCHRMTVRNNQMNKAGGGGNSGMTVDDTTDSFFSGNVLTPSALPLSSSSTLAETNSTIGVSTVAGSSAVQVLGMDRPLNWWARGKTITIDGADYTIYAAVNTTLYLYSPFPTTGDFSAVINWSNNVYSNNSMAIGLAAGGTSKILSDGSF